MVPVVLALSRRCGAPLPALFAGIVVVANAASIAVPMGNPTNLVVIDRLGLSDGEFIAHMLAPGLAAAVACAGGVALRERASLAAGYRVPTGAADPLSGAERHAALALAAAALAGWAAAFLGVAPAWLFAAAAAAGLATARPRLHPVVPWRVTAIVTGLLVVAVSLDVQLSAPATLALPQLLGIAAGVGLAAALANNLPISICAAGLLTAGPSAYAALIGLGVGALATPHGSVATMIATDLVGERTSLARTAVLAAGGVLVAVFVLSAGV
jgi:Na+/H+ antiporter NhaD/arsenite permease-like protein